MSEIVSKEDLQTIRELDNKKVMARLQAEKAALLSKNADLEYDNAVFVLYSKYSLKIGEDTIKDTGEIVRAKQVVVEDAATNNAAVDHSEVG